MARLEGAHYLRPAGQTTTPAAVIILDSESRQHYEGGLEVHTLRCWDAAAVWRRDRRRPGEIDWSAGTDQASAADCIDRWASSAKSTWLYAHNVAFDLVVTGLASQLVARGWELSSRFGLGISAMWCVLHKGRRDRLRSDRPGADGQPRAETAWCHTLTIADSASIWPMPLAELASYTPTTKPPLPADGDSAEAWAARCHADVDILRHLVCTLMDWWDEHDMGKWSVTGAALGWQTYRRTLDPRQVVIDHDRDLVAWERQAVYGGRRDAFKVGGLPAGHYGEMDFESAYPTVAATQVLPAKTASRLTPEHRAAALQGHHLKWMIAEVTLTANVARWPCRIGGRVFYPVGEFRTVLAGPDLQAAYDHGALAEVHDGHLYIMTGHLAPWARQVLSWVRPKDDSVPGAVSAAAKLWSRAVIGKFGQKGWTTTPWQGPPDDAWCVEVVSNGYTHARGVITGLGGRYYLSWADADGDHERPSVLAFVESHVRTRLNDLIYGPYGQAIVQCDTDGVMVSHGELRRLAAGQGRHWQKGRQVSYSTEHVLEHWCDQSWPLKIRDKLQFKRVEVLGPQHVILDGRPRMAGVPKGAWQIAEGRWGARLWPGMAWQATNGQADAYVRPVQNYLVVGPYAAGWVLDDGTVRPVEAATDQHGASYLVPWAKTRWAAAGDRLGPRQGQWAEGLTDDT